MSSRKRIEEGGIYHLTQRAPGRELLFIEEQDYVNFLKLLKEASRKFELDIFSFALLPNHLHILLKIRGRNLAKAMKYLFQSYAQGFNKKYERKGHVFCGVYRAVLCKTDAQLLATSLYIHLNPFKAGLTKNVLNYKWFSLEPYLKDIKIIWVNPKFVLSIIDENIDRARIMYKNLIFKWKKFKQESFLQDNYAGKKFFQSFMEWAKKRAFLFSPKSKLTPFLELEKKINEFSSKKRIKYPKEKEAFKYLVEQLRSQGYSYKEISFRLGFTRTTICKLLKA
ncbi:MAG: transposase [Deltaproteobacteria bacterium]|nr:transposase [Deltaproteobacteria bacterium]